MFKCATLRTALLGGLVALTMLGIATPQRAMAQTTPTTAERMALGLLNTGGYWFTSSSARSALGTPKFYSHQNLAGHSASIGGYRVAGGFE